MPIPFYVLLCITYYMVVLCSLCGQNTRSKGGGGYAQTAAGIVCSRCYPLTKEGQEARAKAAQNVRARPRSIRFPLDLEEKLAAEENASAVIIEAVRARYAASAIPTDYLSEAQL